ncbi:MAG: hypothetical protein EB141_00625 [Verrucomicrobia bacterium]|nr:hypothetical protein [Verrucomicrobiota bacterium]NDB74148.1 hypothetical protein [Verrucomicrobiota bacterium]NDD37354.1 hypothetical protein [Verrucomicrobiota bacterium]NDE97219.1 hypothetical protein [Verrucomicrobiota bacterium]
MGSGEQQPAVRSPRLPSRQQPGIKLHLATQVGTPVKDAFRQGVAAYDAVGFADEWHLHHQGGPCGYQGHDYLGSPTAPGVVLENQPFAWNRSITGTKSKDTILATSTGPEIITAARNWPTVSVEGEDGVWAAAGHPRPVTRGSLVRSHLWRCMLAARLAAGLQPVPSCGA